MDQDTRRKICQLIAGLVITDDVLDDKEEAFVDRMIERFGLADQQRDVIFPLVDSEEAAAQMKKLPKAAQDEAMGLLIEAACVDGQIQEEERVYLRVVCEAIGVSESDMEQRLKAGLATSS